MSAWKPSVFGRSPSRAARRCASSCACRPSRSRLRPRAARRTLPRRRRPAGTSPRSSSCCRRDPSAQSLGLAAESMRTTPYLRMPRSWSFLPMRARLAHLGDEVRSALPRCPSPSRRRSAATPARRAIRRRGSCAAILSASCFRSSSDESMLTCGSKRNRSTPSNLTPPTSGRASGRASCRDRSAARRPGPLPTSPGHIAL